MKKNNQKTNENYDEYYIEKLLFSREKPEVPEELKNKTMNKIEKLKMIEEKEEKEHVKIYNYIIGIFAILMILFGIVIVQNLHIFSKFINYTQSLIEFIEWKSLLSNLKYVALILSLIPAAIFYIIKLKNKHHN